MVAALAVASGCASQSGIVKQYQEMRPALLKREWGSAVAQLEEAQHRVYRRQDRVMFWLNLGTLLHYAGEYERSMENFIKAEETMQELWTKSVSGEIARFTVNETVQGYAGEDHERVLIYLFTAMNRVQQGRIRDALVEARRADEQLKKMRIAYESKEGLGTVYRQDAFMLWLVGVFYEIEGSYNDAFLAYRRALQVYEDDYPRFRVRAPPYLYEDLVRTAELSGLRAEAEKVKDTGRASGETIERLEEGWAEIVLIHGNGEAPQKREKRLNIPVPDGYVVSIALPEPVRIPHETAFAQLRVSEEAARTHRAEPVANIALAQFAEQEPAIQSRAVARAVVKYAATKATSEAVKGGSDASDEQRFAGALIGLIGNIAAVASEAADLRAWTTLPADFGVARIWVPAGTHELEISYHNRNGKLVGHAETRTITLEPRERSVMSVRSVR